MKKVSIISNGCIRENTLIRNLEIELEKEHIEQVYTLDESDYLVYVTCGGLGSTIEKCMKEIFTISEYKKDIKLIIVGCLTKLNGLFDEIRDLENVKIIKNDDFLVPILNFLKDENKRNSWKTKLSNRTYGFFGNETSIQFFLENGCSNHCSFCKTNYMNRPVQSVPYDIALNYLKEKIRHGTKCITLSKENLTLYGIDLCDKQILHLFLHELSLEPGLISIRVGEITATNMYLELLHELALNPKIKCVELQIETASPKLLRSMNRGHTLEEYDAIVLELLKYHKFINTVVMSGYPTETYEDLDFTVNYLQDRKIFTEIVSQYGNFEFLPSSQLEQFSEQEKKKKNTLFNRVPTSY